MSDNLPFEIHVDIFKRLPVKSLIKLRSVSKEWKSLIDSSYFIAHYSSHDTQVQHLLVKYVDESDYMQKYVSMADDDNTFPHHKVLRTVPHLVNMLQSSSIIGCSQGLICLYGFYSTCPSKTLAVIWNLSVGITVPVVFSDDMARGIIYGTVLGFGVCRETTDPKIVKITNTWRSSDTESIPWQVEIFTLSTRAWRRPYSNLNLPRKSIKFGQVNVVIDGFLYWLAEDTITMDNRIRSINLLISFDMTTEEFREVNLPDCLAHQLQDKLSISKLRESLVVLEHGVVANYHVFNVWMMENGVLKSFTKLFTFIVNALDVSVRGFRKSGEPIIEISKEEDIGSCGLFVFEPYTKQISTLGIDRIKSSYRMFPYMETLLLLDQPNFMVYTEEDTLKYLNDLAS